MYRNDAVGKKASPLPVEEYHLGTPLKDYDLVGRSCALRLTAIVRERDVMTQNSRASRRLRNLSPLVHASLELLFPRQNPRKQWSPDGASNSTSGSHATLSESTRVDDVFLAAEPARRCCLGYLQDRSRPSNVPIHPVLRSKDFRRVAHAGRSASERPRMGDVRAAR